MDLLRKKDLHPYVGVPKSTVADWVEDFNVYIPKVKQGSVTYYKPETIDVLKFIKQCRDQNYQKPQIMQMLVDKGFPITIEEAVEDVKQALEGGNYRDNFLTVIQMTGQAVSKLAEQDDRLNNHDKALKSIQDKENGQDERLERMEKRTEEIDHLKREFEKLRKELAVTKEALEEEKKKGFFSRLFNLKQK